MMKANLIRVLVVAGISVAAWTNASRANGPAETSWQEMKVRELVPIDRSSVVGEGKLPVILIPELGCDETIYADFAKRHAERFTTHTVVLPGSVKDSKSPLLERGQVRDPEWLVNAADAVLKYASDHKLEKPLVIGQGPGGTVAYMLAARNPDFASGYVVINTLPAPSIGGPGRIPPKDQRNSQVDKLERTAILGQTPATWASRTRQLIPMQTDDPKRAEALLAVIPFAPSTAVKRYSLEPLYLDMREDLDGARSPILVYLTIPGWVRDDDKLMLKAAFQNVAYNRPNVRLAILDGARPWAILDAPDQFDPPLLTFLGMEEAIQAPAEAPAPGDRAPTSTSPQTPAPEPK